VIQGETLATLNNGEQVFDYTKRNNVWKPLPKKTSLKYNKDVDPPQIVAEFFAIKPFFESYEQRENFLMVEGMIY